ncbi:MAG: putative tellurite resistance protein B-like protein [Cellvibrionaceae bacterium]|jgi:uncharacterized tellurite resistance protein B-like protein
MIKAISKFLTSLEAETDRKDDRGDLQLAIAALLIETAIIDQNFDEEEWKKVKKIVVSDCQIDEKEADLLIRQAQEASADSASLFEFTQVINRQLDDRKKQTLVENLWRIAYADGELDKHEEHIIRRIADLIHLRHSDFIKAKISARDSASHR